MSVLDELRQALRIKRGNWLSVTPPENYAKDRARGLTDAITILDAFEAAHPGLVDYTEPCAVCSKPVNPATSASIWNNQLGKAVGPLCPACGKETTP